MAAPHRRARRPAAPRLALAGVVALLGASGVGAAFSASSASGGDARVLLPDLEQAAPGDLSLRAATVRGKRRWRLGFSSATANVGEGSLLVYGSRRDRRRPFMRADQLLERRGASSVQLKGIGRLRYVALPSHQHWHLLDFARYSLHREDTMALVRPDLKTGFCLGDRYRSHPRSRIRNRSGRQAFNNLCGLGQRDMLAIHEGLSPGWGDRYEAHLEGQEIDVSGLPGGFYQLVHRANPTGALRERTLSNNASSVRLELRWPRGPHARPRLRVIAVCPDTLGCFEGYPRPVSVPKLSPSINSTHPPAGGKPHP